MVSEARLWQFLHTRPQSHAPWCEWIDALGDWAYFDVFAQQYLQLTPQRAWAVNCRTDCGLGCPRHAVSHARDDIVAVCAEQEAKPYRLAPKDVRVYSLNRASFNSSLCAALGITPNEQMLDGLPGACRIGDYTPTAGYCFPVYLTFKDDPDQLLAIVSHISLLRPGAYALIVPMCQQLTAKVENVLQRSDAISVVLSEEVAMQSNGSLQAARSTGEIFASLRTEVPLPDSGGMVHFNTPVDIDWHHITITFVDGHTVSIRAGQSHGQYNYTQMGMANIRNGSPTAHWQLLQDFADNHGVIDNASPKKTSFHHMPKRKQDLSRKLRQFFRLSDDPIDYLKQEGCYRCHFTIKPERDDY